MPRLGLGAGLSALRGAGFSPSQLFAAGEKGAWYDPSDLSTMFTDTAGTTPASVDGPVGRINDKSGNGYHLLQGTAGSRPTLRLASGRYSLDFDGTDDFLSVASFDLTTTDKLLLVSGHNMGNVTGNRMVIEHSANLDSNNGSFAVLSPTAVGAGTVRMALRGASTGHYEYDGSDAGYPVVAAVQYDIAGATLATEIAMTINGAVSTAGGSGTAGSLAAFGSHTLYVGSRAGTSMRFGGKIYGLILRAGTASASQRTAAETWMNGKTGAF